jgi:hypothetical protein
MSGSNMTPRNASFDIVYCSLGNAESFCDSQLSIASCKARSNFRNISLSQFCVAMGATLWCACSVFGVAVSNIVKGCAEPEMSRVTAKTIIATVQDANGARTVTSYASSEGFSIRKLVCNPMRSVINAMPLYLPVSTLVTACEPRPALVWLANPDLAPKVFRGILMGSHLCATYLAMMVRVGIALQRGVSPQSIL